MQDTMLVEVQGWYRGCRGGAGAVQVVQVVQGRCRWCRGGAGYLSVCTSASIISGAGRCRGCRHTSALAHPSSDTNKQPPPESLSQEACRQVQTDRYRQVASTYTHVHLRAFVTTGVAPAEI